MNDLSWIIYAADVVPKLQLLFFLVAACAAAVVAYFVITFLELRSKGELADGAENVVRRVASRGLPVFAFFVIAASLTPSRETILMIAASELGETVATSEAGAQALDDIRTIVTDELARLVGREE